MIDTIDRAPVTVVPFPLTVSVETDWVQLT